MKVPKLSPVVHRLIIIVLLAVGIGCGVYLVHYYADAQYSLEKMRQMESSLSRPQSAVQSAPSSAEEAASSSSAVPNILPQLQTFYSKNHDLIGWLSIDGTNIKYPVMFTPNSAEYYLHRNFEKKDEARGLPFLDAGTDLNHSSNYLIYGHNMKDGTEFADLVKYRSKSYWQKHPTIRFDTLYEAGTYQVMAAFNSKVYLKSDNVFKYYQFNYPATAEQFSDYVSNVKKLSVYDTGINAQFGDRLLTLSTCSSYTEDGRFAVVAKQIGK